METSRPSRPKKTDAMFIFVASSIVVMLGLSPSLFSMPPGAPPFETPSYLVPAANEGGGGCRISNGSQSSGAFCFGALSDAVVFNCAREAASPSGCRTTVVSVYDQIWNYNVTIWFPHFNASIPERNCALTTLLEPGPLWAWCVMVGQNSFIVSYPASEGPV